MSQAEALLNAVSEPTAGTASEGNIVVGRDRYIVVPESLKKIGVQYDHDVETVTFDCPRYWDNWDFSKMKIYVNYMRSDGALGACLCENVVVDSSNDELIHFDWTISGNVTHVAGVVSFLVCIKNVDVDGKELTHWNSELNTDMHVSAGLKCQETVLRRYPDIITQLLARMETVEGDNEAWKTETYGEMDRRISDVEETVSHDSLTGKINECLRIEETTHALIKEGANEATEEYLKTNEPLTNAVYSIVEDYVRDDIETATNIAKGRNQALSYMTYEEMITALLAMTADELRTGQNIYIGTVGVPDVWVYSVESESKNYTYLGDTSFANKLKNTGTVQVGYYKLAQLETQKVDLTGIESDIDELEAGVNTLQARSTITRGTLTAGNTEITIIKSGITENSIMTFFTSIYGVSPTSVTPGNGTVTLIFDAQDVDMEVGVRVDG